MIIIVPYTNLQGLVYGTGFLYSGNHQIAGGISSQSPVEDNEGQNNKDNRKTQYDKKCGQVEV